MTDRINPKAIADELRAGCGNGCKTASSVMLRAADTIDALVEERDNLAESLAHAMNMDDRDSQVIRAKTERREAERERDELAAVIEQAARGEAARKVEHPTPSALADALAEHDRQVAERAWDEGHLVHGEDYRHSGHCCHPLGCIADNPYRKEARP